MRRRGYPGWHMVWALAVTETISYGVLYYSFAAFLLPMQQGLGYGQATLAGAFSLSVLVTGAGAVPAGAWLDCCGARGLMTAGSLLAAGCVLLWAHAGSVLALYLTFAGIGLAGAAVLYEPAFATINACFDAQRQKALLTLTMVAGLASTIFLPGAALLISHLGWRHALLVLALVQAATVVPHVLLLRRRPADHGWQRDGVPVFPSPPAASPPGAAHPAAQPDPQVRGSLAAALLLPRRRAAVPRRRPCSPPRAGPACARTHRRLSGRATAMRSPMPEARAEQGGHRGGHGPYRRAARWRRAGCRCR